MTHTPGKWSFVQLGYHRDFRIVDQTGKLLAVVGNAEDPNDAHAEWLANAHIITTAPDMLDMLKTIENDGNQVPAWLWDRIQQVIAKAEGKEA